MARCTRWSSADVRDVTVFIEIRATFLSGATAADVKGVAFQPARSGQALFPAALPWASATRIGSFPRERVKVEFSEDGDGTRTISPTPVPSAAAGC
jgi:hypothetical protein